MSYNIEYNINDFEFDLSLLPDCSAHMIDVTKDLEKVIGKSEEEIDKIGIEKYYASDLIGIKIGDYPSIDILNKDRSIMNPDEQQQFSNFFSKMSMLIDANDECDKKGIIYIANFINLYYPNSSNFYNLRNELQEYIRGIISLNENSVFTLATKIVNNIRNPK